ncbi:MAG: hypothetical protein H7X80_02595 [bacterium]|nr:hypothetical protein [Candidatus Kapabacteria bacterium]
MEPTLHMQQGQGLLNRVLQFYPHVRDGENAVVTLTQQDWLVLMDFAQNPEAAELRPANVKEMTVDMGTGTINVKVVDCVVAVKMGL